MRLLVTGASGHLGRALVAAADGPVHGTFHTAPAGMPGVTWHRLDVRDRAAVAGLVAEVAPDAVVHTAYDYDDWATNADGAAHVALAARAGGARLVHVSSDAVFGGRDTPYDESAVPDPISPYGASKAAAETAVLAIAPAATVVRTSLVVGRGRAQARVAGGPFHTDEYRCPIHVDDLTAALLELACIDHPGVLHVAGPQALSRYELAVLMAPSLGIDPASVPAASARERGLHRPLRVVLDTTRARRLLLAKPRAVADCYPSATRPAVRRSPLA